jgi:hypothetical protein
MFEKGKEKEAAEWMLGLWSELAQKDSFFENPAVFTLSRSEIF